MTADGTPQSGASSADCVVRYRPRGIGLSWLPCYICGGTNGGDAQPDMAAVVSSEGDGQKVLDLFTSAGCVASLDTRRAASGRFQVKVGACEDHLTNLRVLADRTAHDGLISRERIDCSLPFFHVMERRKAELAALNQGLVAMHASDDSPAQGEAGR